MGHLREEKYLCKNFELKRQEDVCSKRAYFQELTGI